MQQGQWVNVYTKVQLGHHLPGQLNWVYAWPQVPSHQTIDCMKEIFLHGPPQYMWDTWVKHALTVDHTSLETIYVTAVEAVPVRYG